MNWKDIKGIPAIFKDMGFVNSLRRTIIKIENDVKTNGNTNIEIKNSVKAHNDSIIDIQNNIIELDSHTRTIISNTQPEGLRNFDIWIKPKQPIGG